MNQPRLPRVMLVDDHVIMRDGLREVLERSGEFVVVGEASDGAAAVVAAGELKPDLILMDIILPVRNGIDACREILETLPDTRVLMLTAATEEDAVVEAVAAGATGYLQKFHGKEMLLQTLRDMVEGEYRFPAGALKHAFEGNRQAEQRRKTGDLNRLTAREREILTLFAQGLPYARIAEVRGNQPVTVRNAIYGIQDKLGIESKQELVVWAVRNGLLDGWEESGLNTKKTDQVVTSTAPWTR